MASSLHPPTMVVLFNNTTTNNNNNSPTRGGSPATFIPDSPLSSAPNSPSGQQRQRYRYSNEEDIGGHNYNNCYYKDFYSTNDSHRDDNDDEESWCPRNLEDILQYEQQQQQQDDDKNPITATASSILPASASLSLALARQNSVLGRASRKSRLRASMNQARKGGGGGGGVTETEVDHDTADDDDAAAAAAVASRTNTNNKTDQLVCSIPILHGSNSDNSISSCVGESNNNKFNHNKTRTWVMDHANEPITKDDSPMDEIDELCVLPSSRLSCRASSSHIRSHRNGDPLPSIPNTGEVNTLAQKQTQKQQTLLLFSKASALLSQTKTIDDDPTMFASHATTGGAVFGSFPGACKPQPEVSSKHPPSRKLLHRKNTTAVEQRDELMQPPRLLPSSLCSNLKFPNSFGTYGDSDNNQKDDGASPMREREEEIEISFDVDHMTSCFQLNLLEPSISFDDEKLVFSRNILPGPNVSLRSPTAWSDTVGVPNNPSGSNIALDRSPPFDFSPVQPLPGAAVTSISTALGRHDISPQRPCLISASSLHPLANDEELEFDEDLHTAPADESPFYSHQKTAVSTHTSSIRSLDEIPSFEEIHTMHSILLADNEDETHAPLDPLVPLDEIAPECGTPLYEHFRPIEVPKQTDELYSHCFKDIVGYDVPNKNKCNVEDLTETTTPEDQSGNLDKNLLDHTESSDENSVNDENPFGPIVSKGEQHWLLVPLHPTLDDLSSSDETPLRVNGSAKPDRRNINRKNRVYGAGNSHDFWRTKRPKPLYKPQTKTHRQRTTKIGKARQKKVASPSSSLPADSLLPPLVVDPDQLRSIGINAIMAVCNGIGSLFLSNNDIIEAPKQRRYIQRMEPYKKLPSEQQIGRRKRRSSTKIVQDDVSLPVVKEEWSQEWLHSNDVLMNGVYFEEAFQRSIIAEIVDGDANGDFDDSQSKQDDTKEKVVTDAFSLSLTESVSHLDHQYKLNRTQSMPLGSSRVALEKGSRWWMEEDDKEIVPNTRSRKSFGVKLSNARSIPEVPAFNASLSNGGDFVEKEPDINAPLFSASTLMFEDETLSRSGSTVLSTPSPANLSRNKLVQVSLPSPKHLSLDGTTCVSVSLPQLESRPDATILSQSSPICLPLPVVDSSVLPPLSPQTSPLDTAALTVLDLSPEILQPVEPSFATILPVNQCSIAQSMWVPPVLSEFTHQSREIVSLEPHLDQESIGKSIVCEEKSWSLAEEIVKQSKRKSIVRVGAAERIAAVRESRSVGSFKTDTPTASFNTKATTTYREGAFGSLGLHGRKNRIESDFVPVLVEDETNHNADEANYSACQIKAMPIACKPILDAPSSKSPSTVSLLAAPPALRRLNTNMDFTDSFGPAFSSVIAESVEPPLYSAPNHEEKDDAAAFALLTAKPSPERSPMSDFLVSRMNSNIAKLVFDSTTDYDIDDKPRFDSQDSDCSSTDELLSSLDGLVKDLDGMASIRRVERNMEGPVRLETVATMPNPSSPKKRNTGRVKQKKGLPVLVDSLNNDIGIPKGDVMISLLNSEQRESSRWISRVDEAIWRCRTMRRNCDGRWQEQMVQRKVGSAPKGRTSVCVDVDDARVVGGVEKIPHTQKAAIEHLKYDDFDDALALYEDICWSYEQYCDVLKPSDKKIIELKKYIASAHYNLGVVYLLNEEHEEALECFERSLQLRQSFLGVGHVDQISSLVKSATCRFALGEYSTAYPELEQALVLARNEVRTVADHRQIAEILNSLGCLSYMGGEIEQAMTCFQESLKTQTKASDFSMYVGSKFSCQSATLNMSITTANIGFLSLTFYRDIPESVNCFETAAKDQQLLLRDAHVTLITTIEHLAVANLLNSKKTRALQLLRRVYHMQVDAFGVDNDQCKVTKNKIVLLEQDESAMPIAECSSILPVVETTLNKSSDSPNTSMLKVWRDHNGIGQKCEL